MSDMNKAIVSGRLTRDPEVKRTNGGTSVAQLSVASNGRKKQGDQFVDDPTFIDVTVFGQPADFSAQYLKKGSRVLIDGRLQLDTWEDRNTGQKRSKLKVVAMGIQSLDAPPQNGRQ